MKVHLAKDAAEIEQTCAVMLQLRTHLSKETLLEQIDRQQKHGYQIAYVEDNGQVVCVAGFVIGYKLAWGKHIYVDDLVTDANSRSHGAGHLMIDWLKKYAADQGCAQLHLDSGVQRFAAHRFYLREGFNIASHHFSITDI